MKRLAPSCPIIHSGQRLNSAALFILLRDKAPRGACGQANLNISANTEAMAVTSPVAAIMGYHRDSWAIFTDSALILCASAMILAISASISLNPARFISCSIVFIVFPFVFGGCRRLSDGRMPSEIFLGGFLFLRGLAFVRQGAAWLRRSSVMMPRRTA